MSTQLNVTSNLFGLSNVLGLEKQAMRLLRNSVKHMNPSRNTISSMQKIVANAPRARSGALSPTNMVDYIASNTSKLPGFAPEFGNMMPASNSFASMAAAKARRLKTKANDALARYSGRIRSGEVDALDPATLKRMNQLQDRATALNNANWSIGENASDLTRMRDNSMWWRD